MSKLEFSKELAENVQKGDFGEAQQKAQELAEKALSENATPEEKEKIANELGNLSKMLSETNPELAKALANLAAALKMGDSGEAKKAMEGVKLSLEDLKKLLEQLKKLSECQGKLGECKNKLYCALCKGMCKGGTCRGQGLGLGGPGRGQGNRIGQLPDVKTSTDPSLAPGDMTKGKILATIMQRAAPTDGQDASIDYSSQAIVQIQQQSEEALTKEEIPPGAKEFVRQYFGSLEPDNRRAAPTPIAPKVPAPEQPANAP
jgi:hypothetical protein